MSTETRRRIAGRDPNYLRDAALFWPFVLSSIYAVLSAFAPSAHELAWRCTAIAAICLVLAKEKILLVFAALGFIAVQSTISLIIHGKAVMLIVAVATGGPVILANKYWKNPRFTYSIPERFGAIDMLLAFASICAAMGVFYLVSPNP